MHPNRRFLRDNGLTLALLAASVVCLIGMALSGLLQENTELSLRHGQPTQSLIDYLGSAQLWFESFENWQSEFLSTAVLVVLSIVLRHRGSPESKPVALPHSKTGH